MSLDPARIGAIVAEVLEKLERDPADPKSARPLGIHASLDDAVAGARKAFAAWRDTSLDVRAAVIASIRDTLLASLQILSELAVEETGLGRVEDKLLKNRLVAERTPGIEDLDPVAWTGDHGLTLLERAPYGVIAVITPVTNPSETIINNGISMIAGGNTCVFCPHPNAKRVSSLTIDLINRAARRG